MTYSVENPLAYTHRASRTSRYVKLSTDRSAEPGAAAPGRSASCGINVDCPAMCALGERGDRAPSSVPPPLFDTFGRAVEQNAEKEEKKKREFSDTTVSSPANSLVIVSVVGASALIQCVIQAVLLTWLNSPLRVACTRLVLLFLLSTSLFAVQSVLRIGLRVLLRSLTDLPLFSVTRHSQQLTGQHTDTAPAGIEVSSSS